MIMELTKEDREFAGKVGIELYKKLVEYSTEEDGKTYDVGLVANLCDQLEHGFRKIKEQRWAEIEADIANGFRGNG